MPPLSDPKPAADNAFLWDKPLNEARFHARACLLAVAGKQQSLDSLTDKGQKSYENDDVDDSDDIDSETDTIAPRQLATAVGPNRLPERFLVRLAELLSREKTPKGAKNIHTAATVMFEIDGRTTVFVAKNGGLDMLDRKLIEVLQLWLRAVAMDGKGRDIRTDRVWKELLKYYSKRLEYYRSEFDKILEEYARTAKQPTGDPIEQKLLCLHRYCHKPKSQRNRSHESRNDDYHDMVCLAYDLRQHCSLRPRLIDILEKSSLGHNLIKEDKNKDRNVKESSGYRTWQWIMLLGRLRVAYDTFMENALCEDESFRSITILPGGTDDVPFQQSLALSRETRNMVSLEINRFKTRHQKQFKVKYQESCFVHAEVQLLMQFEHMSHERQRRLKSLKYMGCSKKTCYLCCRLLAKHGYFRTRSTHGKVYHRWTIPATTRLLPASMLKLKAALLEIENDMIVRFAKSIGAPKLPEVPESSIGISEHLDPDLTSDRKRQLGLDGDAHRDSDHQTPSPVTPLFKLGKARDAFLALRIPAKKDEHMEIVRLTTYEVENDYDCCDSTMRHVPDFSDYWTTEYTFDRAMYKIKAENQTPSSLNGDYRIHCNKNDDLPANGTLKSMLRLEEIPSYRKFWYGDVFVERIGNRDGIDRDEKGYHLYDDITPAILTSPLLELSFRYSWDNEELEAMLVQDASFQQFSEQHNRDKDLVYQRMYIAHYARK